MRSLWTPDPAPAPADIDEVVRRYEQAKRRDGWPVADWREMPTGARGNDRT